MRQYLRESSFIGGLMATALTLSSPAGVVAAAPDSIDQVSVDQVSGDQVSGDQVPIDQVSGGQYSIDEFAGLVVTRIEITGRRVTREYVIRRELKTAVGQPLNPALLARDLQRLDNLDIFSSLSVTVREAAGGVVVTLRVRELPFAVPYVSYDVTDEDGWSFGPALKSVNMLGRDLFVGGWALFGGKDTFLLEVIDPWIAGNHLSV